MCDCIVARSKKTTKTRRGSVHLFIRIGITRRNDFSSNFIQILECNCNNCVNRLTKPLYVPLTFVDSGK